MPQLKRTYQVASPYTRGSKRARTLTNEVRSLKKQVTANKKELKYYDGRFKHLISPDNITSQSFFKDVVDSGGFSADPTFVGRKIHVRKIEIRIYADQAGTCLIWREKRPGKDVASDALYPLGLDPEYHTLLRYWEQRMDSDATVKHMTIDFGIQGRLVEFDEQSSTTASGDIVSGDIKMSADLTSTQNQERVQFRVWYTDS